MANIRNLFKSRVFILLFSMFVYFIVVGSISAIFGFWESGSEVFIVPILSLLFGPFAALACALSYLILELFLNAHPIYENLIFNVCTLFLSGIFVWKLWYASLNRFGFEIPNLGKFYNYIKIFLSYVAFTFVIFSTAGLNTYYVLFYDWLIFISFSIIAMLFAIYGANHFKIPAYTPKKQFKQFFSKNQFNFLLLILIVSSLILSIIFKGYWLMSIWVIVIFYSLKPYDSEVFKIKSTINPNLIQKVTFSVFVIFIIIGGLFLFFNIFNESSMINLLKDQGSYYLLLEMSNTFDLFIVMFLVPFMIYIYYLEKYITKPINKISDALSEDLIQNNKELELKETLNSMSANNEIKNLADSLIHMEEDVSRYREVLLNVTAENEKYETELYLADSIQSSMIPKDFDKFCDGKNFKLWGLMKPAREVGGDFYDYFQIDDDNIGFVIGDVSGKGITASLVMVEAITLIQDYAKYYGDISKCFVEVNNLLCERNEENQFVTSILGKLNLRTGVLSLVNAGHNAPLFKRFDGNFEYIEMNHGLVLAIMEDMHYESYNIKLNPGDMLFLYTDGVTEANDNYSGFYGEDFLKNVLDKHSSEDLESIINTVEDDVRAFSNYQEQFDDMTMFIIRYDGSDKSE